MAKHALLWVSAGIGIDYFTSWVMMSILGPNAEGSVVARDFFIARSPETFALLVRSQLTWIVVFGVSLLAFLMFRYRPGAFDNPVLAPQKTALTMASIIAWLFGAYRLVIAPTSNLSAFVQSAYGQQAGNNAYAVLICVASLVVFLDFFWVVIVAPLKSSGTLKSHSSAVAQTAA